MNLYPRILQGIALLLFGASSALAQGGNTGNGGDIDETTIFGSIKLIEVFLRTDEGRKEFPELSADRLRDVVARTDVTLVRHKVKDKHNRKRTAVNLEGEQRYLITFNVRKLNKALKHKNYAGLVILIFHEFLNLMKEELSRDPGVSSIYDISARIAPYAERIWKNTPDAYSHETFGFMAFARLPVAAAIAVNQKMLDANYLIQDKNPLATQAQPLLPELMHSQIDAAFTCQTCGETSLCRILQGAMKSHADREADLQRAIQQAQQLQLYQTQTRQQQQQQQQMQQQQQQQQQVSQSHQGFLRPHAAASPSPTPAPIVLDPLLTEEILELLTLRKFRKSVVGENCAHYQGQLTCVRKSGALTCFLSQ